MVHFCLNNIILILLAMNIQEFITKACKAGYITLVSVAKSLLEEAKGDEYLFRQIIKQNPGWLVGKVNPGKLECDVLSSDYDVRECTLLGAALYADNKSAVRALLDAGADDGVVFWCRDEQIWIARDAYLEFCSQDDSEDDKRIRIALGIK